MDPSLAQRRRGRRARTNTSQENLIKDSSSDVSPRETSAPTTVDRHRQRRAQRSTTAQQFDNQAFTEEERPPPHPIERVNEDDEEEENVQNANRLESHLTKEHHRKINELQQQDKKTKKITTSDGVVDDQHEVTQQIQEGQQKISRHIGDIDEDRVLTIEPLPATIGTRTTTRDRSLEHILERAKRSRAGQSIDDDQLSTMGSSRRYGGSTELKLQQTLRGFDINLDPSLLASQTFGDGSSRFDPSPIKQPDRHRQEIDKKQQDRTSRWKKAFEHIETMPSLSDKDDFFLKIWTDEKPGITESQTDTTTVARITTADTIVDGEPRTTDESAPVDDQAAFRDQKLPEEKQPLINILGDIQLAQYQRAERAFDQDEERDLEEKKFKYVVGQRIGLQEKLGDGIGQPRSLEEEGIFVGKRPIVPTNVVRRAEKRILQECVDENKPIDRWFGPDGAIVSLPDPTKFVPTRPLIDDLFDPALGKEFYKAYQIDSEHGLSNDPIGADRYRLDIDLGKITFVHHHLMSMEHVLAMKMKQMYECYTVRRQQRIVHQLSERIKALKSAENKCQTSYEQKKYADSSEPKDLHDRLVNYQNELRQARNQRCNEMKLDRDLLKHLLDAWKEIKDIRRANGYTTTSVKLIIKQISGRRKTHYEQMQQQIEEEIGDEITLADEQYQREKEAYSKLVRQRKLQDTRKKEAKKRLDKKRATTMTTDAADGDYDQKDIAIINEEDIYVPEKPEPRKQDEIRTTILAKYQNAIRPADEPEFLLELVYSEQISTDSECNESERARRHNVQTSSAIFARILINGKIMADTPTIPLTNEFEGHFGQIFPCYVVRTPETIKIEFYEASTRFRSSLAEVYLSIPETTVTSENYQLQAFEFSSNILRQFNPKQTTAVGSGIPSPIQFGDFLPTYLNIEGALNAGVAWGVQDDVILVPPDYATSKAFLNRQMGGGIQQDISMQAINLSNMKNLIEWIKQSNLDPYDPENAFLINIMKDYANTRGDTNFEINALQHFRLSIDENDEIEQDDKHMDIDNSLRFKLLQARKENLPEFKDFRYVPTYDYLVRKKYGIFKKFMDRQKEVAYGDIDDQQFQARRPTRIDIVRRQGERQLRKMREQISARFALSSSRKSFNDMVIEENIPDIRALRGIIANLYIEPTRPLYPSRRRAEQKKVTNLALTANRDVFILVNVIGALDLPTRRTALEKERTRNASNKDKIDIERLVEM
ncbi:unnamed protein product [Rotaria sp. Silwood1]|nr:unnamed protein product [Rotaria sp. Silwood1]CAF4643936.1 unnamed protein product [Rotaria sp. Silwood1]